MGDPLTSQREKEERDMESQTTPRSRFVGQIIQRAASDPDFRKRLIADTTTTVESMLGVRLPEGISIRIVQEAPNEVCLVLPAQHDRAAFISDEALAAAGAADTTWGPQCQAC
jgi:hypothetical protein